ncbi:DEAD/DEAH box helicase family protein [Nocardioides sp. CGMCC 1.13656]|uniref:DEAD/DEAH box helicase family protein n=1 Tax=Nocardioides TaxID=1839 RepID=UPI0012F9ED70|nr:DEAD/DEAH box helicase family protein [Nocardioides sp. CGMCC 1.13656]MBA2952160.1 DEAD/DEAH box helicase family protein [Nocardioides sp. CGMCC 1.13656]
MDLGRLIDTHRGARSYGELSRDCGGSPSSKRLQQLVTQPIKNFPDPPTVKALARGLKLSEKVVTLAAAESLGLDVSQGEARLVELLPAGTRDLTEEQAAAVAHLVRTIVDATTERGDGDVHRDAAPMTEPKGVVWARTGSGKTATMAAAIANWYAKYPSGRVVLVTGPQVEAFSEDPDLGQKVLDAYRATLPHAFELTDEVSDLPGDAEDQVSWEEFTAAVEDYRRSLLDDIAARTSTT